MIPQLYFTKTITGTIINPNGFDTTSMGRGSVTHGGGSFSVTDLAFIDIINSVLDSQPSRRESQHWESSEMSKTDFLWNIYNKA